MNDIQSTGELMSSSPIMGWRNRMYSWFNNARFSATVTVFAAILTVLSVNVSAVLYFLDWPSRKRASISSAWTIVAGMEGKHSEAARGEALRILRAEDESLEGLVLDGAILRDVELSNANLFQASLRDVDFKGASFEHSSLRGVVLIRAKFSDGCNFRGSFLEGTPLQGAQFADCDMSNATLRSARGDSETSFDGARMKSAQISGSDLRGVQFNNADLSYAQIDHGNLDNATFHRATVTRWKWTGTEAKDARFEKVMGQWASFRSADLERTHFDGSDLSHARFHSVNLKGASFFRTTLTGAHFEDCDLSGANFTSADLSSVVFSHCIVDGTIFRLSNLPPRSLENTTGTPVEVPEVRRP